MNIIVERNDAQLKVTLEGRLDSLTSPELENKLNEILTGEIQAFELDLASLEYVSSAGLRVILGAQKKMIRQGSMVVSHVQDAVMEVFEMTGFSSVLTIQ